MSAEEVTPFRVSRLRGREASSRAPRIPAPGPGPAQDAEEQRPLHPRSLPPRRASACRGGARGARAARVASWVRVGKPCRGGVAGTARPVLVFLPQGGGAGRAGRASRRGCGVRLSDLGQAWRPRGRGPRAGSSEAGAVPRSAQPLLARAGLPRWPVGRLPLVSGRRRTPQSYSE